MLGVKNYSREYVDACRAKIDADVAAYRGLAAAKNSPARGPAAAVALAPFEAAFFNNMVIVLDALFVHRLRNIEGKDGNPLNEVRVLAGSLMGNNGVVTVEGAIKLSSDRSVLKHRAGDRVRLTESDFAALSNAYFDEIERKYV